MILRNLLEHGKSYVKVENKVLFVPELTINIQDELIKIIKALVDYDSNCGASIIFGWCCYAGMGATMHWHRNWSQLQKDGIFKTLTRERGIFAMDEYILDLIGLPFQKEAAQQLTKHLQECSNIAITQMAKSIHKTGENKKQQTYMQCCEAMYRYGMVIELNRLGMN